MVIDYKRLAENSGAPSYPANMPDRTGNYPSKNARMHSVQMLVAFPLGVAFALIAYLVHGGTGRVMIERQFVNCYVSEWAFIALAMLMVLAFALTARIGANVCLLVANYRLRFLVFIAILSVLGVFVLQAPFLSHQWFERSAAQDSCRSVKRALDCCSRRYIPSDVSYLETSWPRQPTEGCCRGCSATLGIRPSEWSQNASNPSCYRY